MTKEQHTFNAFTSMLLTAIGYIRAIWPGMKWQASYFIRDGQLFWVAEEEPLGYILAAIVFDEAIVASEEKGPRRAFAWIANKRPVSPAEFAKLMLPTGVRFPKAVPTEDEDQNDGTAPMLARVLNLLLADVEASQKRLKGTGFNPNTVDQN